MKQKAFFARTLFLASQLYPVVIYSQQASAPNVNSVNNNNCVSVLNQLIIATNEQNNLQGLINNCGEWVVKPSYKQLIHKVGDYYDAQVSDVDIGPTHQLYRLNREKKQLELQPFYILDSNRYLEHWVIVHQGPDNSFLKGLLDITTHQLSLPTKYNQITISDHFIIAQIFDRKRINRHSEVYSSVNFKILFSGQGYITIDKNNSLVQNTLCSEDENSYYEYSTTDSRNITQYCHQIYQIYDQSGRELPTTYSHNFNEVLSQVKYSDKTTD